MSQPKKVGSFVIPAPPKQSTLDAASARLGIIIPKKTQTTGTHIVGERNAAESLLALQKKGGSRRNRRRRSRKSRRRR